MTSALSVSTRKTQSLWNDVHQNIPSNSVIVKNLSPATSEDAIMIHFQRKRNGGGEVERVRLLSEGVAVVTFEKPEVADSVLGRRHEIEGALVTLERHNIPCPDQVFGKVSGRLDPHALGVSFSDMEVILRTIHDETKANWKEIFDGFVVSGTFEQLKIVRESLSCHLKKAKEYRSMRTPQDSREPLGRDITATREFMVDSKVSTESTSLRTSAAICLKSIDKAAERKCNNPLIPNENQAQGNKGHGSPYDLVEKERVTTTVNDSPKKLDQLDVTGDVSNTRKKSKAQVPDETESQSDSTSRPTPVTPSAFLENSKEKTIGVEHLKTEVVDSALQLSRISKIGNTSTNVKRPQDQGEDQGHGDVENLLISVKKQEMPLESSEGKTDRRTKPKRKRPAGSLNKDVTCEDVQSQSTLFNRSCDAENTTLSVPILNEASDQGNQSCSHLETPKFDESLSKGKDEYTIERNSLKYITSTGITVWLQKGDITSSDVGVLLIPANPTLSYKEGLCKLILEKGGHILKEELHRIAQAKCPLPYGNVFLTSNGNLPCRGVLHTVLPPWMEENENKKAYKRQIHRSLIDALTLASGYRHRSVAISPLGQDGNCIPLEVSAEVITRVIAKFSESVGPMHTGINDIHIVCEDDDTVDVFAKELSSFSFSGDKTYFTMAPSENVLQGEDKIAKYQGSGRTHAKCEEGVVPTIADQLSVQHIQKSTSSPKTGSVPKNENTEIHANFPKNEIVSSSQLKPHKPGSPTILPFVNGKKESVSSNSPRQCCENTITIISSTSTKIVDIAKENEFEILKVSETATIALVEGVPKRVATQDDSSKKLNLKVDDENFKEGNGNVAETREVLQNISAPKMSKALTPEIQQPKPSYFSTEKEQSKSIPGIESRHIQRGLKDTPSLHPFHRHAHEATEVHSLRMDNSLLVTSPTVEALLNADLRLGVQGLHIEHERNRKIDNGEDEGSKSFLSFQPKERNSNEHLVSCITTSNEKQMITEKYFQEDINENHQSKMISEAAEKGHKRNSPYDKKCDSKETDEKKDESEPTLVDNVHNGNDGKVSAELPVAFMCALCQDTVDHPELIHPNFCVQHKFCDDCILKVFTFSSNCPVCVDSYGLTAFEEAYNAAHNHPDEYDTKDLHPSVSDGSSPLDQEGGLLWTAYPDVFKASQPPGQMMWKKNEDSLPGFEGFGTIVVTFTFYGGIQSSEHPSPGAEYKGMSCIAYLPYTEEGEQVLKLLWKAFDARLVFTVSNSASDPPGQVELNGVELKTSATSDARNGYPDHGYLSRVRKQLAAKGFQ